MRFDLSDEEWSVLEPLMPKGRKSARPHDWRIINAIFYVLRTGIPWRDLPERYGPYTSAYNRFNRWSRPHQNDRTAEKPKGSKVM
jgi:transposase